MLIQSGGGNVYAVLARNTDFELSIMPGLQVISTSVFLALRCRYKSLTNPIFDPMLVPKAIMIAGIDRSDDTLRGTLLLNTGRKITEIGPLFAENCGKTIAAHAPGVMIDGDTDPPSKFLRASDIRDDFVKDFGQLVESHIAPIYPQKDFSAGGVFLTAHDMKLLMKHAEEETAKPTFTAIPGGQSGDDNLVKVDFKKPAEETPVALAVGSEDETV